MPLIYYISFLLPEGKKNPHEVLLCKLGLVFSYMMSPLIYLERTENRPIQHQVMNLSTEQERTKKQIDR